MMTRKWTIMILFLLLPNIVRSQDDDFGTWASLEARYGLSKKFSLEVNGALRTFKNSSTIDEGFVEGGINYKVNSYLGISASFRLIDKYEYDGGYYFRHKFFVAVRPSLPVGRFTFSGRAMLQRTTKTYIEDDADLSAVYAGRFKLKAYYNIPAFPLNPYVYCETFVPLSSGYDRKISKNRFSVGAELKLNKRNSIELEYIFQRDYLPHLSDMNIISVNYAFKF